MTTIPPQETPEPALDPLDENAAGDRLVLAKNGWVRFDVGELVIRLRPPFFGELSKLRGRMEAISDEIADASDEVASIADELEAENARMEESDLDDRARMKARREAMRRSSKVARDLTQAQEALWLGWWAMVIETLAVDTDAESKSWLEAVADDHGRLPAWAAVAGPAMRVLTHWRQGPLARG